MKVGVKQRALASRVLLAFLVLLITSLPAQARSWRIADFHSNVAVDAEGVALVEERIDFVFVGVYHGIWRSIPIRYPGPHGSMYSLFLERIQVTDGEGKPLKTELSTEAGYRKIKVYIPEATDTAKRVLISYSIPNAIRFFDNYDEFYWNVTGNDWPVPIDHASALVVFPDSAAGTLRAQAFTGFYGATDREATTEIKGATVSFDTTNPLPMRAGLTIDVALDKGILRPPSTLTRISWFLKSNGIVLLPLWTFVAMFGMWWFKGRDPDPGLSVAPMYEPPAKMPPAEAGTLIDDSIDPRDITSTLVDLAVRGYIKIEQTQTDNLMVFHSNDYVFHLLKPREQWTDLASYERVMLDKIFSVGGQRATLSKLRNSFYTAIPVIKNDVFAALKRKGMYWLDPESAAGYMILGVLLSAAPFAAYQVLGSVNLFESVGLDILCIAISLLLVWLFGRQMPAKTTLGARTRVAILGFQEFMNRVDADRIKRLPPDTFEKYLPYAMALGVEHQWAQAFAGIVKDPPSWYVGPHGTAFNPVFFTNSMRDMATTAQQTFVSAPRASSSGSGFGGGGGGGFSGGGFGGGGGGAF